MSAEINESTSRMDSNLDALGPSEGQRNGLVLLVGDWFVDDHWVLGAHRSSTSSRTGRRHLAALQEIGSATESLCGAGRTASVLWGAQFSIIGVGVCAESDGEVLLSLLDAEGLKGRNPHTLRRWESVRLPERASFCNLGDESSGTSRAIRIYERFGDATILTQRLDWETPPPRNLRIELLEELLRLRKQEIQAVILEDLGKGFIRQDLVSFLVKELADKPWFISTKFWQPDWFEVVSKVKDIPLLLIPEAAARAALGTKIDEDRVVNRALSSWMATSGSDAPSKGALALVANKLLKGHRISKKGLPASTVVVVPDDWTVLALDASKQGYVFRQEASTGSVPMAMSSVLLGALTARMLRVPLEDLAGKVEGAAAFTYRWREFEARRVIDYRDWNPTDEPRYNPTGETGETRKGLSFNWREAHEQWQRAFTLENLGIIEEDGPRLELWRSMTELPGYVCVVRKKRATVAALVQMLRAFARSDRSKQESCLLTAPPGTGKTHLVRCLAEQANFRVLSFNVTHLYRREELLDCFDRISTTQAENDTPLLVFFDEINADLGGAPPYASFLSPLEEGVYVRAEKAFHIGAAVWLFAATVFNRDALKAPDFESRLTRGIVELSAPREDPEGDATKLERIYLTASLLKSVFREIEFVSEDVLDFFRRLPEDFSTRQITQFVTNFRNVQRRKVVSENIPWNWLMENRTDSMRSLKQDWEGYWKTRQEGLREVRLLTERR